MKNIKQNLVLLDFSATWCAPCRVVAPIIHELAESFPSLMVQVVDVDENQELAVKYNVRSVPTLIFLKDDQEVGRIVGARSSIVLHAEVEKFINT